VINVFFNGQNIGRESFKSGLPWNPLGLGLPYVIPSKPVLDLIGEPRIQHLLSFRCSLSQASLMSFPFPSLSFPSSLCHSQVPSVIPKFPLSFPSSLCHSQVPSVIPKFPLSFPRKRESSIFCPLAFSVK